MANNLDLEEQEQLDQLRHFWASWGSLITGVLTVALVALAGWNGYQYWQKRQAVQASSLYDSIEASADSKDFSRLEQSFAELRRNYGSSAQAFQAALLVAKTNEHAGNSNSAKEALTWLVDKTSGAEQAIARLRLASIFVEQGSLPEALAILNAELPAEFSAVVADRKGDVLALMGKTSEAVEQYKIAFGAFEAGIEYKRLVEIKLNALGSPVQSSEIAVVKDTLK